MAFRTLFKTFDEFIEFVPVSKQMDPEFVKLPAQIYNAQNAFISKEIGRAFFNELLDIYIDGTPSTIQMDAIYMLQAPLANYSIFLYAPKHKVTLDSQGIRVSENEKEKDAKPFDTTQALEAYLRDSYTGIEQALEFLEENKDEFPTWTSSKEYTAFSRALIRSTSELEAATGVLVTRRLFRFIKPHISRIETQQLDSILGKNLLSEILDQIQSDSISPTNKAIIDIARPAVAFTALNDAISLSEVEWSDLGITVLSNSVNSNVSRGKVAAPDQKIANLSLTCKKLGPEQLALLQKFIIDNAADYPLFVAPEVYNGGPMKNKDGSGVHGLI